MNEQVDNPEFGVRQEHGALVGEQDGNQEGNGVQSFSQPVEAQELQVDASLAMVQNAP